MTSPEAELSAPEVTYECEVCESRTKRRSKDWMVATFEHITGDNSVYNLDLMLCAKCGILPSESILGAYKARVASGRHLKYH